MKTLVLGGSVFVGRRLVEVLLTAGHDTTVLNRGHTPTTLPPGIRHVVADRTDPGSMRATLAGTAWDAVFDVSGFVMAAGGGDIAGLLELLDGRVGAYVFVSSIMAYDQSLVGLLPWTEDLPDNPAGARTYGGFKALSERAILARHASTGFPGSVARPAAIYGPGNNIFDMETPMFLRLEQGRPILLPHSGLVSASYGHVDDLCEALVTMATHPGAAGELFNITGEGVTSRRYVTTLAEVVGAEPDVVEVPDAVTATLAAPCFGHLFGIRHHAVLSTEKAAGVLGFAPRYGLRDGHEHTYHWFQRQGWSGRTEPLVDLVWKATWDFDAEAAAAKDLR
jgi:nucleoside-diphosphate-sugar epimerase